MSDRKNPFFEPYNTPHDTVPFDRIRMEDYERLGPIGKKEFTE